MRIRDWHQKRTKENASYAAASAELSLAFSLADLIVNARVARGLSQAELAEAAGTTQATVSHLENAEGNPRLETLGRVFHALGIAPGLPIAGTITIGPSIALAPQVTLASGSIVVSEGTHLLASPSSGIIRSPESEWHQAKSEPVDLEPIMAAA